jgi:hypothetical protein
VEAAITQTQSNASGFFRARYRSRLSGSRAANHLAKALELILKEILRKACIAWEPEDLPRETACMFYVVAVEECFGRPVERVRIIYLRNGHEVRWSPEREDVEAARKRLSQMVREIRAETEFTATPGDHCRFFPFALTCAERTRVDLDSLVPADDLPFWDADAA